MYWTVAKIVWNYINGRKIMWSIILLNYELLADPKSLLLVDNSVRNLYFNI